MTLPAPFRWLTATAEIRALREENAALRAERDALRERMAPGRTRVQPQAGIDRVCEWGPATYAAASRRR